MLKVQPHLTADELAVAAQHHVRRVSNRIMAVRALFIGAVRSCREAAALFHVTDDSVRRWVKQYNANGLEGLFEGVRPGRPPILPVEKYQAFKQRIVQGPSPMKACRPIVAKIFVAFSRTNLLVNTVKAEPIRC